MKLTVECVKDLVDTETDTRLFTKGIFYTFSKKQDNATWWCVDDSGVKAVISEATLYLNFIT